MMLSKIFFAAALVVAPLTPLITSSQESSGMLKEDASAGKQESTRPAGKINSNVFLQSQAIPHAPEVGGSNIAIAIVLLAGIVSLILKTSKTE